MPVTQADNIVIYDHLYTVLQVEPRNKSPIILPGKDNLGEKLITLLRKIAPEYFTEEHRFWKNETWLLGCNPVRSAIITFYGDVSVYSNLDVKVYTKRKSPEDVAAMMELVERDELTWGELSKKVFSVDKVKTVVVNHCLGGYEDLEYDGSGKIVKYSFTEVPLLDNKYTDKSVPKTTFAALLAREGLEKVIHGDFMLFDGYPLTASINNPTAERVKKAAGEFGKYLDYIRKNETEIILIGAMVEKALSERGILSGVEKELGAKCAKKRLLSFARKSLRDTVKAIDRQISALPPLDCSLLQYLHQH